MTLTSNDLQSIINGLGIRNLVGNDTLYAFLYYLVPKLYLFKYFNTYIYIMVAILDFEKRRQFAMGEFGCTF